MSTFKTDVATGQQSTAVSGRLDGSKVTGRVAWLDALYKTGGGEQANDYIEIAELPIGAVLLPDLCRVSTEGVGGTSSAISMIGDALDEDRYSATSIAIVSAGTTAVTPVAANMYSPYQITESTKIVRAKLALAAGNYSSIKIVRFRLAYLMP